MQGKERERSAQSVHEMRLAPLPFAMIRQGAKTVEVRLYDEKRRAVRVGDGLLFRQTEGDEVLSARVKALHRAPTFFALFQLPGLLEKAGCAGMSAGDAARSTYAYYSAERESKYGVLGIELDEIGS